MKRISQIFLVLITLLPMTVYSDFNDLGHKAFNAGDFDNAIKHWEKALVQFGSKNQNTQYIDTAVHLAIAYQTLGLSQQALDILENAKFRAKNMGDKIRHANVLSHLGDIYIAMGEWQRAQTSLEQAESLANKIGSPLLLANILNKQGNLWRAREDLKKAFEKNITNYQKCLSDIDNYDKKQKLTDDTPECELVGKSIYKILKPYRLRCSKMSDVQKCFTKTRQQENFPHCIELFSINKKVRFTDNALQCLAIYQGIEKYQKSSHFAKQVRDKLLAAKISLNLAQAQIKMGYYQNDYQKALSEIKAIQKAVSALPDSSEKAFALIQSALLWQDVQEPPQFSIERASTEMIAFNVNEQSDFSRGVPVPPAMLSSVKVAGIPPSLEQKNKFRLQSYHALIQTQQIAHSLQDNRTIAYVKGYLAQLYAEEKRYNEAIKLTQHAIFYAQPYPYILYRWEWELGKLFKKQKKFRAAIGVYKNAVEHLENIRRCTLKKGYRNLSQSFRETEGQLYFEFADLLLAQSAKTPISRKQSLFKEARNQIESFKLAELENYFKEECVSEFQKNEADIDKNLPPHTALLYPIMLADRIELLLSVGKKFNSLQLR